ncbi:MAG: hydrogenase nickel incorporation protein HypA [Canidatus Methanoxibalbensis ujae]|nr:hydrogenase nickel incorporation protein HypA [Candidatus Methanoxibalbensis ujae]
MHEWALAEAVIAFLMSASHGMRRVRCVKLRIGELYQMDMDIFITALHEIAIAEDSKRFADMKITWEKEKALFKCRHCGNEWNFKRREDDEENEAIHFLPELIHAFSRCPACGCPDFDVVRGKGILVERIEGEQQ